MANLEFFDSLYGSVKYFGFLKGVLDGSILKFFPEMGIYNISLELSVKTKNLFYPEDVFFLTP